MAEASVVVHEMFASIQGESTFAGLPCAFVRLTGCNLRCAWCDTTYAFDGGTRLPVDEAVRRVLAFGIPLVEVTGGEPLLQPGALALLRALCDAGKTVLLETNGAELIEHVDARVHRIVDLKAPASGEVAANRWENLEYLCARDELKIVLADRADYEWARALIGRDPRVARAGAVHLSCAFGQLAPEVLAAWILEDRLRVRLQLQLHKFIWPPSARGV